MPIKRLLPGIVALCLGAVLARILAIELGINHLLLAIAIGFLATNSFGIPTRLEAGIGTHNLWLGSGIVLMGASLTLEMLFEVGEIVLVVVVCVVGFTILIVEALSRTIFGLGRKLGTLLAAGSSICGVSAVVAVAGAIRARQEQIAYAAGTVLLFDAVTIVVYPIVGDLLGLSGIVFGIWAGVSMFSTGPVVAVGFAHSELAGQWATMTKLARNTLIGVIVLMYASYYARDGDGGRPSIRTVWDEFPKFVLGFLALVFIGSLGVFSETQQAAIENAYNWLFVLAFVGLGAEIRLRELRSTGIAPVIVGLVSLIVVSTLSLAVLTTLF